MNVTPTNMGPVSEHTRSYKEAQDQDGAKLLLDFNRAQRAPTAHMNHELQLSTYNGVDIVTNI